MDAILTTYPLSSEFNRRLGAISGPDAERLNLAELRQLRPLAMIGRLRSVRADRILVPFEDENGRALAPILLALAAVIPATRIVQLDADLKEEKIGRTRAAMTVVRLIAASMRTAISVARTRREVRALLAAERVEVAAPVGKAGLFLNSNLWFGVKAGGSVGHISGVVNALAAEGYAMTLATAGGRLMADPSVEYCELRPPRNFGVPWETNFYHFHFGVVEQMLRLASAHRSDFIYQRLSIANYSGVALSRKLKIPLILEYNGSEAWVARNWGRPLRYQRLAERAEEVCLRHAHLIVTISEVLRDELLERGISPERIVTYPNCIDPEFINPDRFSTRQRAEIRTRCGIGQNCVLATFLGTFGQWHGAEALAGAIRSLCDAEPQWVQRSGLHFLFVGDGVKMPDVLRALGPHANGPHVTLTGLIPQREAPLYLAASDILVSPHVPNADGSRFFGSPTKLFEYLAMGRAILASNLDQIGEVLAGSLKVSDLSEEQIASDDRSVALLATPGDRPELIAGLKFLVDHPEWRSQLGRRARELALRNYTWQHHVRAILDGAKRLKLIG